MHLWLSHIINNSRLERFSSNLSCSLRSTRHYACCSALMQLQKHRHHLSDSTNLFSCTTIGNVTVCACKQMPMLSFQKERKKAELLNNLATVDEEVYTTLHYTTLE
jgi:hypothetical protein